MSSIWSCIRVSAAAMRRDSRGVAAIEFAMIVPLMLVMLFGTIDVSSGVAVKRKVTLVARTLSDLTSQSKVVGDADITNFLAASYGIMWPYPSAPVQATISELYIDPATSVARVQWSQGSSPRGVGSTVSISSDLIGKDSSDKTLPGQYLIYSEVSYLYQPIVGYVMAKAGVTLSDTAYTRPRQSMCVTYPTPPAGTPFPPCPTN
ncbi:TadE-like protein [Nitrobacter hamburgensis X14]|uniref:TadE-like protein n=1 Tax=Nitrobacter hamburgensis (strain DSM 10229 / NCIMB 13809 / X14) TaxID=323097 RepID=Q1QR59_NITHX|nr:TadE/TadG family type IV pilus assembly protein [Nitrobacter hamburgensis]ABE61288.1 TadE-like protein [Nitrobacter hamburgensis X14]